MTSPALIERITRSLAYMLRHQPEEFDLELDAQGFGDVDRVVQALNERLGEPVTVADLHEAVHSGDRPRYEIQGSRVRALYGHSIDVEPGEPSRPPELLFVGISGRDADRAARYGLRGGRRRFLHLALTAEDAKEAGRRTGREYVLITVYALDAWEEGINFFDRRALFLAEQIPTEFLEVGEAFHDGIEPEGRGPARRDEGHDRGRGRPDQGGGGRRGGRGGRGSRGGERGGDRNHDPRGDRRPEVARPAEAYQPAGPQGADVGGFGESDDEFESTARGQDAQRGRERAPSRGDERAPAHAGSFEGSGPGFERGPRPDRGDRGPRPDRGARADMGGRSDGGHRGGRGDFAARPDDFGGNGGNGPRGGRGPGRGLDERPRRSDEGFERRDEGRREAPARQEIPRQPPPRNEPPWVETRREESRSGDFGSGIFEESAANARSAPPPARATPPPPVPPREPVTRQAPPDDGFGAGV